MNKALIELINKAKAVKTTNDALIESFEKYVHLLMQQEIDYEYVTLDEFKKSLKHNSWRMALYEVRLNSLSDEENFNQFCRFIHLQIEGLLNYYISKKHKSCDEFKISFSKLNEDKLNRLCDFEYSTFKKDYEEMLQNIMLEELGDDKKEEMQTEFNIKYENNLLNFLKNKYELKVFIGPDEEKRIRADLDFSIIHKGIKAIEDKFNEINRIPFSYKFEYFLLNFELDNNFKITVEALTDYRNKELSHSGEITLSLTKNAKALKERKNFMALKDCIQEINLTIKNTDAV